MDVGTLILQELAPLAGKRILDVGCGKGALLRKLVDHGAEATGVEPAADTLTPLATAPPLRIVAAGAEKLPFPDRAFDAAIFLNSFHHVPVDLMDAALMEVARVVEPGGMIVIVEPLAEGTFFAALRPIEDETEIRAAAQAAIARAALAGRLQEASRHDIIRRDFFPNIEPFLQRVLDADEGRRSVIAAKRREVEAAFEAAAMRDGTGSFELEQPIRAFILLNGQDGR